MNRPSNSWERWTPCVMYTTWHSSAWLPGVTFRCFGICRGEQLINVAFGGTLYQDIPTQHPDTTVCHQQQEPSSIPTHTVHLTPGSAMASITGQTQLFTNTHHHQAVKQVAPGFSVTGWSSDSIPEAIESSHEYPIWGVQFHPEALATAGDSISARFFYFLVQKATTYRHAKEIQSPHPSPSTRIQTPHFDFDVSYNIGYARKNAGLPAQDCEKGNWMDNTWHAGCVKARAMKRTV